MMKKSWLAAGAGILAVGAGLLISQGARAGQKTTVEVVMANGVREFAGSMGSVRNSADSTQRLYCSYDHVSAFCLARNAAGTTRSCTTSNANMMAAIRGINGDSYLLVQYDAAGNCTRVYVNNGSYYAPKTL